MTKKMVFLHIGRGILASVWSEQGLYELTFPYPSEQEARGHLTTVNPAQGQLDSRQQGWQAALLQELERYFSGEATVFTVPIDWSDYTEFRLKALQFTADIPSGQVATYGGIATAIGCSGAARAVGGAMHANRTPIVVPCHRVVGSDGSLTGFGGGLTLKQELLGLEKR
ncbi:MAG: ogt 2 [Firmicutes bacterium]|nr:ogt 2 [Bacillota bacterium]